MFRIPPFRCKGCNQRDGIKECSVTVQAPVEDTYWYCTVCKDEIDSSGRPLSIPREDWQDPDDFSGHWMIDTSDIIGFSDD